MQSSAGADVELGHAGGSSRPAIAVVAAPVDDLELGLPGKSPLARERPVLAAAEPVELGTPGAAMFGDAPVAAPVAASPRAPIDPGTQDDMSFEGLLDPTGIRPSPLAGEGDDAPTALRSTQPPQPQDDFGLDGLTPPPAEVPSPSLRPSTQPAADDDGPTNLPPPAPGLEVEDVSVDLSEHLSIGADDLKEAVRQSQVMQAVDVPAELLAELEGKQPEPEARVASPSPLAKNDVKQVPVDPSTPVELPSKPAVVSKGTATEPPPQREEPRSSAGILLLLLVFVLVGAGAAYYFLVYKKQQDKASGKAPIATPGPKTPVGPPQPPAPAKPTAALGSAPAAGATITMPETGAVEWLIDDGATVEEGDALVRLKGYARLEKKANAYDVRHMQYQDKLDRAKASMENAAESAKPRLEKTIAAYEAKVSEKVTLAQATRDEAAKLTITAAAPGTVKVIGRAGAWTKAGDPLVEVAAADVLSATFAVPAASTRRVGDPATVRKPGASDMDMSLACSVTAADGDRVTVTCARPPPDTNAPKEGDQVELQ
jgi:hypothetical protein